MAEFSELHHHSVLVFLIDFVKEGPKLSLGEFGCPNHLIHREKECLVFELGVDTVALPVVQTSKVLPDFLNDG